MIDVFFFFVVIVFFFFNDTATTEIYTLSLHDALPILHIVSFGYILFAIMFAFNGIIRGVGDTMIQLLITVISLIILRVPLAYFLANHTLLKETGIWIALPAGVFVATVLNIIYYLSGRWKRKIIL